MTRRTRLILVGIAVAVLVLALAAYLTLRPSPAAPASTPEPGPTEPLTPSGLQPPAPTPTTVTTTTAPAGPTFARASSREILEQQLIGTGGQFAERFGTYSNQSDFQNLIDLFPLMTDRMREATERTIEAARATSTPSTYVGVTTRAVTTAIASLDEGAGRATIRVSAQRVTQTGDAAPVAKYEILTLEFRKVQNVWKVDSAVWSAP